MTEPVDKAEPAEEVADELSELPGPPKHLSPSGASSFRQCARRWKFRYIDKLPDPPGEAAVTGTCAHMVLEKLMQEPPEDRTVERARELATELKPEMESSREYLNLGLNEIEGEDEEKDENNGKKRDRSKEFRQNVWRAITGLWDLEDPREVKVAETEQDVRVEINGVPFRGIIDRVDETDDGLVVTDYKSGRVPPERFSEAYTTQMLLYAAALTELHGQKPAKAQLFYLGQEVVDVEVTDENLAEAVGELRATWLAIVESCMNQEFEATVGPLCGWCPFVAQCPEGTAEVTRRHEMGAMKSTAPALELLGLVDL